MKATNTTVPEKKARKKKELTPEQKKARALKASIMRGAHYVTPTAPTLPTIKQEFRPSPAIVREHAPEPGKDKACCIACAAKMLLPSADPERVGDRDRLQALTSLKSWKSLYDENGRFCMAQTGAAFIRAAMRTPGLYAAMQKELAKWAGEHLAFFNRGNPERIAAQLALYGIDSGVKDFYLRTPKAWHSQGHKVKPDARPIFVITPLFSDKEKEKAEQEGAAVVSAESTTTTGEKRRKFYACHAVFATCDTEQVRIIKRRAPRKQKKTVADYRAAAHAAPAAPAAPAAKKPRKASADPAPAPAAFTPADSADLLQMALAL